MSTHSHALAAGRPRSARVVIEPSSGWRSLRLGELWTYRELIGFLVWRDLKVRYRQTLFGVLWVLLQPLALMVVFSLFLGYFLHVKAGSVPYPVVVFAGLVPWTLFSQALTASSQSLITNSNLLGKIYFPRLVLPVSAVGSYLLDAFISVCLLFILMGLYGVAPSPAAVLVPAFLLIVVLTAIGVGSLLTAINVRYRDVQSAIPLLVQLWLFASPIAYPATLVPEAYRALYALNPMVSVVEGFRWALLGQAPPSISQVLVSAAAAVGACVVGILYFRRVERTFADIV